MTFYKEYNTIISDANNCSIQKGRILLMAGNEEKKKALDAAIAKLEKDFGKGTVMRLGDSSAHVAVETVPTGCLSLDLALGLGEYRKDVSLRYMDRSPAVRRRWRSI